jgi:hypothetical protein
MGSHEAVTGFAHGRSVYGRDEVSPFRERKVMTRPTLRFAIVTLGASSLLCAAASAQSNGRDDLLRDLKRTTQEIAVVRSSGDGDT